MLLNKKGKNKQNHLKIGLDRANQAIILNCVADGVFTVDENKKICFFNKAAEKITGFSQKEALGLPCRDVFRTGICSTNCTIDTVKKSGQNIIDRPIKILNREGKAVMVSISAAVLKDEEGNIIGGVETFRDLTIEEELKKTIKKSYTFQDIISRHTKMHELFAILPDIAVSDASVLLEGESGTGKELFAHALHNLSSRKNKPFIAVNCGALPDTLLESELFGYKKGAFTDAKKDKPGRFDLARGGTLFLDEIGDISQALQIKLLRVLQMKVYEPLGATQSVHADVRIIAATNKRLLDKLKNGSFREDLYYRLNVIRLELPPLRERRSDIPLLADFFRQRQNTETGKNIKEIDEDVINTLMNYDYPGNVRELENIIQHAFVLCKNTTIKKNNLPKKIITYPSHEIEKKSLSLIELEKKAINKALLNTNGNHLKAAKELGINPSTLYRKLKRYDITYTQ